MKKWFTTCLGLLFSAISVLLFTFFYPVQNSFTRFVMVILKKIKKAQLLYLPQIFSDEPKSVYGKTAALFSPKICMPKGTAVI